MNKNVPHISNYFKGGMMSDTDFQFQPPNTYRRSINGRILFNVDGGFAWENDKGNKFSFQLKEWDSTPLVDYRPIGKAAFSDKVVLFSTDGVNSEIGFVSFNDEGVGTYQQIFNDKYDPNGDKLNFDFAHSIEAHPVKEAVDIERVYWVDNFNQDSVIGIFAGQPFSWAPTAGVYPYWYSVHSLRQYCDWKMGRIKYMEQIDGRLKTGVYQYSYRMGTKDGYRTPWYPLTRHILHTGQDPAAATNYNDYQMQSSNDVTVYGKRLNVVGVDSRFPILEVAFVYSISETQAVDAAIFYHKESVLNTGFPSTVVVDHVDHSGDPISLDEFNIAWYPLRKSKTLEEKDSYLFKGNVTEVGVLEPDLTNAGITPITRLMKGDSLPMDRGAVPVTNTTVVTDTVAIDSYTGAQEIYEINSDFDNYKGTQWEHLFRGYWRGETYRIGVQLYDMKGMPNYVFHLDDYTFPEQFDDSENFTLTQLDGGEYKLRMLGMNISGIKIPVEILYDEFGNQNISGFSIVRAKRAPYTRMQGVILNTVFENSTSETGGIDWWRYTRPLPMTDNYFIPHVNILSGPYYNNAWELDGVKGRDDGSGNACEFGNRAGTFLFYSPEFLFGENPLGVNENGNPTWELNDRVKLVGLASTSGHMENEPGYNKIWWEYGTCHYYSKNYNTNIPPTVTGYTNVNHVLGDYSFIEEDKIYRTHLDDVYKIENYDNINDDLIYTQFGAVDFAASGNDCDCCEITKYSWGMPNSLLMIMKDFSNLGAGKEDQHNRVFLANYQRPNENYYSQDGNALEKTQYIGTGHFQPINNVVINDTKDADGNLIFNGIEVWGGDCFVSYFDFTRLISQYRDCDTNGKQNSGTGCDTDDDCYEDYSVSMVTPIESRLNVMLRYGRQFARDGVEPEDSSCGAINVGKNGIQEKQREDFNINSVLQQEENVQFFVAKPTDIQNRKENPITVIYSRPKSYGEPLDNYRKFYANQFLDLTGANGSITELFTQYSYIYYLQTRGFGRLYINQPATLPSSEQGNIIVGSAGVLTGALYISQEIGCQHQFSVTGGHEQTYWVDVNLGKMYRFSQNGLDPISDLKGQHNKIYEACKYYHGYDAPNGIGGIHGTYDYNNNELVMTFHRLKRSTPGITDDKYNFTIVYSENVGAYVTFLSVEPRFWFNQQGLYFSDNPDARGEFYVHLLGDRGEYYGVLEDSVLELVVNPDSEVEKVYNGCRMNINSDGVDILSECRLVTEKDNILLSLPTDTRKRYRHNYLEFPTRGLTQVDRVRGKWLKEIFTIDNVDNKLCRVTGIESKFGIGYSL